MTTTQEMIADRYELIGRVSSGGMGEVYRARDHILGRTVAVKLMGGERAADEGFVAKFRAEAQAAARLSHTNVVQIYDWGRYGPNYYMVMEFVRGRSLRDVISQKGALQDPKVARVMLDVLAGLGAAHQRGLVHRDVKPENVLVSVEGEAKVADFGIARSLEAPATEAIFGTVTYVAPERLRGEAGDARADIYSAGCVLYELLVGNPPYSGDSASVISQHLNERVPVPSSEGSSPELDEVVLRATAKDPAERFENAHEMASAIKQAVPDALTEELGSLVEEMTDEVSTSAVLTSPSIRPRKSRWPYLLTAAFVVAVAVVGFLFRPVSIADVIGVSEEEAIATLESQGFTVETRELFSPDAVGDVIRTDPGPGSWALRQTSVVVIVSRGLRLVPLDDLVGLTLEEARDKIREAGFLVGDVTWLHGDQVLGTVIDQTPQPGKIPAGDPVNLVVSLGPEMVTVPNLKGSPVKSAQAELTDLGLEWRVTEIFDDNAPVGEVLSQDPAAGSELAKGSAVGLTVSKGPEPFDMPDVEGKACSAATTQLEELGLKVVLRSRSGGCGSKAVLAQDPLAGTKVKKGDEATIFVD